MKPTEKNGEKIYSVTIPLGLLLIFSYWWVYGLFGFFSSTKALGLATTLIVNAGIVSLFILLCWVFLFSRLKDSQQVVSFASRYIFTCLLIFSTLLLFSLAVIFHPVNGDHFFHIQHAQTYSLLFLEKILSHLPLLYSVPADILIWVFNLIFLSSVFFFFFLLTKIKRVPAFVLLILSFMFLRIGVIYFGGNPEAFPSLRFLPILVANIMVPIFDFGYRISSLIGLVVLILFLQNFFTKYFSLATGTLVTFAIVTIPVVWHTGLLVESSIWTMVVCVPVLFLLFSVEKRNFHFYLTLISLVAVATLLRTTAIICLFPLFIYLIVDILNKKINKKEAVATLFPLVCLLPLIAQNFLIGNPAAVYSGKAFLELSVQENADLFSRLSAALSQGVYVAAIKNSLGLLSPLLLISPVLLLLMKKYKEALVSFTFFVIFSAFVFSIDPFLWGNGRYQAEYLAPFIALCIYLLALVIKSERLRNLFLVTTIVVNIVTFSFIPFLNKEWFGHESYFPFAKKDGAYFILSEYPVPYTKAMTYAKKEGYEGKLYSPGYSYIQSIMAGFSLRGVLEQKQILNLVGASIYEDTYEKLTSAKTVEVVLLTRYKKDANSAHERFLEILEQNGWYIAKSFYDPTYESEVALLLRKK